MKAVFYERPGPAREVLCLDDMPTPKPGTGEVLVRIAASGVNPSDVKLRAGGRPGVEGLPWPRIVPHSDGAGIVEAVGDGVDAARIGERVWLWNGQWDRAFGTCADYIALPSEQAVRMPDGVSCEIGACLGIPATTAHACLLGDGPVDGRNVLITGGAGAVSTYAIQMARLEGARVFTTVSTPEKAAHAREMGADHVIDYRENQVAETIHDLTDGHGIDRVIDLEFGANIDAVAQVIRPHGIIVAYGSAAVREPVLPFYTLMFKRVTLRTELIYLLPPAMRRKTVDWLTRALEAGTLKHRIAAKMQISQTAEAHQLIESGSRIGCVVLSTGADIA